MPIISPIPPPTSAVRFRGRIDSDFNRNLVHLGLSVRGWGERRDSAEDREAVRKIITGLLLQDVAAHRVQAIRLGLCRAIAQGEDREREQVSGFAESLTRWYDGISEHALTNESKATSIIAEFDAQLAAIEAFVRRNQE